ncbi:MAG: glycosyltransferase family 4 protein [Syntrophorhabdaceae bacterium]
MRVLFLVQGLRVAASRYRVFQYIPYLTEHGIEASVTLYPRNPVEMIRFLGNLPKYDCLFLQRKRFSGALLALLRRRAKKIIYDFDDSVMYRNSKAKCPHSRTRMKRFADMVSASDYVIAGNRFLMEKTLPFSKKVDVLPTALDANRYIPKDYGTHKESVTLGWIGDHGSIHYMEKMKPIFEKLGRRYPKSELSIVCDTFIDCREMSIIKKAWSQETEIADLRDMDIGLMPLMNDLWSEGKCGLKILQYFGVAVPAVCTPVGVNKDVVKDGITGFYANSPDEWVEKLSILIENPGLRRQMGERGREIVMNGYTIQACAPRLIEIIENTVKGTV